MVLASGNSVKDFRSMIWDGCCGRESGSFPTADQACNEIPTPPVKKQLNRLHPWKLKELSGIQLFDRVDTKFLLPAALLPELLFCLHPRYRVLEIGNHRAFEYHNLYFDTPEFNFFAMHHNGKLNRRKARLRSYIQTKRSFVEVKLKTNTKKTIKVRRISRGLGSTLTRRDRCFLKKKLRAAQTKLVPTLFGRYMRISLADAGRTERVTLDFNLAFGSSAQETLRDLEGVMVAELKQAKWNRASSFANILREWGFRPGSFSKYCVGCCLTYPDRLKTNNFKPQLLHLKRVQKAVGNVGGNQ